MLMEFYYFYYATIIEIHFFHYVTLMEFNYYHHGHGITLCYTNRNSLHQFNSIMLMAFCYLC